MIFWPIFVLTFDVIIDFKEKTMNKKILSFALMLTSVVALRAQLSMNIKDQTASLSGEIIVYNDTDGTEKITEVLIHNNSTKIQSWHVSRHRLDVPLSGWEDYLCWGPESDPLAGTCYTTTQMAADNWTSSEAPSIQIGEAALLQIHINPADGSMENGHYRYYIASDPAIPADSFDIVIKRVDVSGDLDGNGIINGSEISGDTNEDGTIGAGEVVGDVNGDGSIGAGEVLGDTNGNGKLDGVESAASIKKVKASVNLSVYPNPATDYVLLTLSGSSADAEVTITDVLGKEIANEKFSGSKKFNVRDFKNGVYVMSIVSNGNTYTKRFVIKHD